ncbi:hypothetical protein [Streptomyces sp. NBC_01314]|uniref:hypothetical protein n=1 Tax=Streptomyces sp. NBC_01314 TaxID=2903821 RepID=UPI00308E75C3|nr:hypothetical protein OG622_44565 [Streptomyces sp. NBC_01314]
MSAARTAPRRPIPTADPDDVPSPTAEPEPDPYAPSALPTEDLEDLEDLPVPSLSIGWRTGGASRAAVSRALRCGCGPQGRVRRPGPGTAPRAGSMCTPRCVSSERGG